MPTEEVAWKQIDHELVTLKLNDVAMNLHRETEKKRNDIRRRNLTNENAATIPLELIELELRQMKQWVFNLYSLYKEVWKIQGKEETPQFIRAVYRKAILPLIKSRTACSRDFLTRRATRTSLSRTVLAPQLLELGREAERLRSEWRRKTEIEARQLAHSAQQTAQETPTSQEQPKSRRGRKRGTRTQETVALDEAIKKAKDTLSRKRRGPPSTKEIIPILAEVGTIPLPAGWRAKYGVKSWKEVLSKPQLLKLASKRFAKVRPPSL